MIAYHIHRHHSDKIYRRPLKVDKPKNLGSVPSQSGSLHCIASEGAVRGTSSDTPSVARDLIPQSSKTSKPKNRKSRDHNAVLSHNTYSKMLQK